MEEYLDIVDEKDHVISRRTRDECLKNGLLHRAITVFVLDRCKRITLQKRAQMKQWYPGFWTASCTGHVNSGEDYSEAAARELGEELGLKKPRPTYLFKFLAPKLKFNHLTEWEFIAVFETNALEPSIHLNSDEIEEIKFVPTGQLKGLIESEEETFTPDSVLATRKYLKLKDL